MKRLLVFDIDGTLLQSTSIQMSCLRRALHHIFESNYSRWGEREAKFTTDSGILAEISQELLGRAPSPEEAMRFETAFLTEIQQCMVTSECVATAGAAEVLGNFGRSAHAVAIATGGLQRVSSLKMNKAKLPFDGIPAAFAEDGFTKEEVIKTAVLRAEAKWEIRFDEIVYFGDASYDLQAARTLGLKFVGVGDSARQRRLIECGAKLTVPDLTSVDELFSKPLPM